MSTIHLNAGLSQYYPPIYVRVFQVVSFPQVSPSKPCIHLSCLPCMSHALPIPLFFIWLFEKYLLRAKDHKVPCYVVLLLLLLLLYNKFRSYRLGPALITIFDYIGELFSQYTCDVTLKYSTEINSQLPSKKCRCSKWITIYSCHELVPRPCGSKTFIL